MTISKKNHPGYKNITIDSNNLLALPEDGSIHYSLPTQSTLPEAETLVVERNLIQNRLQAFDGFKAPDTVSVVPDLHLAETELSQLQQDLDGLSIENFLLSNQQEPNSEQRLSLLIFRQTPISKFDDTFILRMIFPTLFPTSEGDINLPQEQKSLLMHGFDICYIIKMGSLLHILGFDMLFSTCSCDKKQEHSPHIFFPNIQIKI